MVIFMQLLTGSSDFQQLSYIPEYFYLILQLQVLTLYDLGRELSAVSTEIGGCSRAFEFEQRPAKFMAFSVNSLMAR